MTRFIAIVAMGADREIGADGKLLWSSSDDMKHFKNLTEGHTVVMGRNTYNSLPNGALHNRSNIVITSQRMLATQEASTVFWSGRELEQLKKSLTSKDNEIVWLIGGQQLYQSTMRWWDEVIVTKFPDTYPWADTFFPEFEHNFNLIKENTLGMLTYCYYTKK